MAATTISQRQVADGSINDAKVQAGAAIASSKLADGANFVKKDGSVPMSGALNMGSQLINAVQTPSAGTDAANKAYVDTAIANLNSIFDNKASVRVKATANVTVANPGTAVFDGVTLANGERLFLGSQTAPAENGIYIFNGSGVALTRSTDMDAWAEVPGAFFAVEEGSANADTIWLCTANAGGTLGTTAITFQQIPTSAGLLCVTLNAFCGTVTMNAAALAAAAIVSFTVTNSKVAATDVIVRQHDSGGTIGAYTIEASIIAAGSFKFTVRNNTAGSLSEAIVIRFVIIKAVIA